MSVGAHLGAYRLIRCIGTGGMAEVFLAEKIGAAGFSRNVALKTVVAPGAEDEAVQLFLDEARLAGQLDHPHIVHTLDLGFEDSTLFIVMEYVPGPALSRLVRALLRKKRFLPSATVAFIGAKVASALDYAWARATAADRTPLRMVHRDISPQNIMVTRDGLVKLSDFGVARASIQTHRTRTGQVRGKAAYMAPEQVRAQALDGRTDVFALCLVLYEAATATRPYHRPTDVQSMRAILTDDVPPIRSVNPDVDPALERAIMTGLAKSPEDRWQSASELQHALETVYAQQPATRVEHALGDIVRELFGAGEPSAEAGPAVESWQPTIADRAGIDLKRIGEAQLSTRIALMLKDDDATPSQPQALSTPTAQRAPRGEATKVDRPTNQPKPVRTTIEPPTDAGSLLRTPTLESPALQRTPVAVQVALPVALVAAVAASVLMWPRPETPARTVPARPTVDAIGDTPRTPEITATEPRLAPPNEPSSAATSAVPTSSDRPAPESADRPASPPPHRPAASRPPDRPPLPSARTSAPQRAPSRSPRRTAPRRRDAPPRAPVRPKPASFQARVLAAKRAHETRGNAAIVGRLTRLLLDLSLRQATDADRALLSDAERALR